MMLSRAGNVLCSVVLVVASEASRAAHPFVTDDAATQRAGKWQLELLAAHDRHDRVADPGEGPVQQRSRTTTFNPVLTYGLLEKLDVALSLNYIRYKISENGPTTDAASGLSDSALEMKWRFYEQGPFSLALKPGLLLPTGDENRGLGTGRTSWNVNLIADYEVERWVLIANVAYARANFKLPEDEAAYRRNLWRVSGGIEYVVLKEMRLVGELGIRTNAARNNPFFPGRTSQFAMLGVIYSPSDKIDLDIGLRKALNRAEADTTILVGATLRW
jgi:Putative MetA-pathway of phenol degradation